MVCGQCPRLEVRLGGRLCGRRWALSASLGGHARAHGHQRPAASRQGVHRGPKAGAEALHQPGGPAPAPMPGNLFEGNPVDEGTTRRGTDTPVHRPEKPVGSTLSSTSGLSLREQLERQGEIHSSTEDEA